MQGFSGSTSDSESAIMAWAKARLLKRVASQGRMWVATAATAPSMGVHVAPLDASDTANEDNMLMFRKPRPEARYGGHVPLLYVFSNERTISKVKSGPELKKSS